MSNSLTLPTVTLSYWPPSPTPGDNLTISLEIEGKFPENSSLVVDLLSKNGERMCSKTVDNFKKNIDLSIPEKIKEGIYILQVIYQNQTYKTFIDIFNDQETPQILNSFGEGLLTESELKEAIKRGDYSQVKELQEKVIQCYKNNPELAARFCEELAEKLYEKKAFSLSRDALNKSLEIYSKIQELEDKEEILARVNNHLKIVKKSLMIAQIALTIKERREAKNLSQGVLAHRMNIRRQQIENWEKGEGFESLEKYIDIAIILECHIYDLIINHSPYVQIEEQIKNTKWTLHRLAHEMQIPVASMQELTKGKGLEQYVQLSQFLGYTINQFLHEVEAA